VVDTVKKGRCKWKLPPSLPRLALLTTREAMDDAGLPTEVTRWRSTPQGVSVSRAVELKSRRARETGASGERCDRCPPAERIAQPQPSHC